MLDSCYSYKLMVHSENDISFDITIMTFQQFITRITNFHCSQIHEHCCFLGKRANLQFSGGSKDVVMVHAVFFLLIQSSSNTVNSIGCNSSDSSFVLR